MNVGDALGIRAQSAALFVTSHRTRYDDEKSFLRIVSGVFSSAGESSLCMLGRTMGGIAKFLIEAHQLQKLAWRMFVAIMRVA